MSEGDTAYSNEAASEGTRTPDSDVESSLALHDASRNTTSNNTVAAEVGSLSAKIT